MTISSSGRLIAAFTLVRDRLLSERTADGHWTGELSTSALSTATAVVALEMVRRQPSPRLTDHSPLTPLIDGGLAWLARHQNADGGWGDTTKSISNISTTMLAHAAYHAAGQVEAHPQTVAAAQEYIDRAGGVPAMVARYGKDRTFSVPILTHCALAGLVDWRDVKPLPFELACLPPQFYKTVRLPVVSYALPALIAIGQVRHHRHKPWNPLARLVRRWAIEPSLRVLQRIQPENGGFLEATPLTSFVTMSLAGMGRADHPVARRGVEFLVQSVQPDGSWPIDTNLATWVTTLAVNALGPDLPPEGRPAIREWLLAQQYRDVHPYTNADPGGWAWTDLPGGVPDADDTPGAILALLQLRRDEEFYPTERTALAAAVRWLLDLQNRDGGWPTFCRGWGALPFDRSAPDLTAHALRALSAWFERRFGQRPQPNLKCGRTLTEKASWKPHRAIRDGFAYLARAQRADGSWLPLWFGNQHVPDENNPTYGTARVLAAYRDTGRMTDPAAQRGLCWLRANQNPDGGWGAGQGTPSSIEETALATEILLADEHSRESAQRGLSWLLDRVEDGSFREPTPIGFYFAKLWYFERLYPLIFLTAALRTAVQPSELPAEPRTYGHETRSPKTGFLNRRRATR